jgi:chromosome segregation ATPase
MSQALPVAADPTPRNGTESVGHDSVTQQNGVDSNGRDSAPIEAVHFGIFNDQIRNEMHRLQEGLTVFDSAVAGLTKTFGKHGKMVRTVAERYSKDEALEERLREKEIENRGIWKNICRDRDSFEKTKSEMQENHEKELSRLREQANAGEQEKKKYEDMKRKLLAQHDLAKQKREKELEDKKAQLESENAAKIANLETEKTRLEVSKNELERQLQEKTMERDQARENLDTMQRKARTDIQRLEKTLADFKAKYEMVLQPSQL